MRHRNLGKIAGRERRRRLATRFCSMGLPFRLKAHFRMRERAVRQLSHAQRHRR
jgi:hypothetical protein